MKKQYNHTFVIGKFMNFHQGHVALIKKAIELGNKTTVLISKSNEDQVNIDVRLEWLNNTFGNWIDLRLVDTDEQGLSNKSESCPKISAEWAKYIKVITHDVDCIVSSEDYGAYVAYELGCHGYVFDQKREQFKCSSTSVREGQIDMMASEAKRDMTRTVALIGPESCGKTVSLSMLSNLGFHCIPETARDLVNDVHYTFGDLDRFAIRQHDFITSCCMNNSNLLVATDSSALTTMVYSKLKFGKVSPLVEYLFQIEPVDEYLLFMPDCPYEQDGTRTQTEEQRWEWYHMALSILSTKQLPFRIVKGRKWYNRNAKIVKELANGNFI